MRLVNVHVALVLLRAVAVTFQVGFRAVVIVIAVVVVKQTHLHLLVALVLAKHRVATIEYVAHMTAWHVVVAVGIASLVVLIADILAIFHSIIKTDEGVLHVLDFQLWEISSQCLDFLVFHKHVEHPLTTKAVAGVGQFATITTRAEALQGVEYLCALGNVHVGNSDCCNFCTAVESVFKKLQSVHIRTAANTYIDYVLKALDVHTAVRICNLRHVHQRNIRHGARQLERVERTGLRRSECAQATSVCLDSLQARTVSSAK